MKVEQVKQVEKVKQIGSQEDNKKWIWVPCKRELFKPAYIVEESATEIKAQSNALETFKSTEVFRMNPGKFDRVNDLALLSHLNEPSVLYNLQLRYFDSLIYTYSGLFLIALNPYKKLGIYADENKDKIINNKSSGDNEPHIFSLANEAYRCMLSNRTNQSILITGESGAGKTENTKRVIEFISYVANQHSACHNLNTTHGACHSMNQNHNLNTTQNSNHNTNQNSNYNPSINNPVTSIETLLVCANPILEAFGNAKTVKNDNSSRFGKFIQLKFKGSSICGARIEKYLLEKSRVAIQSKGERSYHIFYYLLRGATPGLSKELFLTGNPADYNCLKHSCFDISNIDDSKEFHSLNTCFDKIGIENPKKYFRLVAAILHLSNIEFVESNEGATIKNEKPVQNLCKILDISIHDFTKQTLCPTIKAGKDLVTHYRNVEECYKIIEGLMKLIYDSLFDNLVFEINTILDKEHSDCFIGVLDIAGFEIFEKNSFEQLCINYTNEKLQQFFNHHMFILEQEIYKNENINWNFIDFGLDLEPTIQVIEGGSGNKFTNNIGILSYLDEECVMPMATDETLLNKIRSIPSIEQCKFKNAFKLKHYAGKVEYEVNGWLSKNKDIHSVPLHDLISGQFTTKSNDLNLKKGIFRTISQSHRENLRRLMELLGNTNPHFVRCILPNLKKKPDEFTKNLILDQLRCNGVLEGIRISRLGYPTRITFESFVNRYQIFLVGNATEKVSDSHGNATEKVSDRHGNATEKVSDRHSDYVDHDNHVDYDSKNYCQNYLNYCDVTSVLLNSLKIQQSDYKIGNTMVFLKQGILADIEELRSLKITAISKTIQSILRSKILIHKNTLQDKRIKAVNLLQKNALLSLGLLRWPWWSLFIKIKPLLEVQKNEENLKEKEEKIREYSELVNRERNERKVLESEIKRIEILYEESLKNFNLLAEERENLIDKISIENYKNSKLDKIIVELKEMILHCEERESNHNEQFKILNEKIRNMSNEIKDKENTIIQLNNKEIKEACDQISRLKREIENKNVEIENYIKIKSKMEDQVLRQTRALQEAKDLLIEKETIFKDNLQVFENTIKKLKNELEDQEREMLENLKVNKELECKYNELKNESNGLECNYNEIQCKYNALKVSYNVLENKEKSNRISLEKKLSFTTAEVEIYKKKLNEISQENESLVDRKELNMLRGEYEKLKSEKKIEKNLLLEKIKFESSEKFTLLEKIEILELENEKISKEKIEILCNFDIKEKQEKKALQSEIQRLKVENEKLKSERLKAESSSSLDEDKFILQELEKEKIRKISLEKKLKEIETFYAIGENKIRELENQILTMEESRNLNLEEISIQNKENLDLLRNKLEIMRKNVNEISDVFQRNFFEILKKKEEENEELLKEIARIVGEKSEIEMELIKFKDFDVLNGTLRKEMEDLIKAKGILKEELDIVTVNKNIGDLEIKDLKGHITKIESRFNERESEIEKIREDYNVLRSKLTNEINCIIQKSIGDNASEDNAKDLICGMKTKISQLTNQMNLLNDQVLNLTNENAELQGNLAIEQLEVNSLNKALSTYKDIEKTLNSVVAVPLLEKEKLVSSFVIDKDSYKTMERKMQINCNCKFSGIVKVVPVVQQNKEESIRLENENNLLNLKVKQLERQWEDQKGFAESVKGSIAILKNRRM